MQYKNIKFQVRPTQFPLEKMSWKRGEKRAETPRCTALRYGTWAGRPASDPIGGQGWKLRKMGWEEKILDKNQSNKTWGSFVAEGVGGFEFLLVNSWSLFFFVVLSSQVLLSQHQCYYLCPAPQRLWCSSSLSLIFLRATKCWSLRGRGFCWSGSHWRLERRVATNARGLRLVVVSSVR